MRESIEPKPASPVSLVVLVVVPATGVVGAAPRPPILVMPVPIIESAAR